MSEVEKAFETQRGEILLERPRLFCGAIKNSLM